MYAELHAHSAYSFLDGASLPEELVASAAKLGYRSLALTDHNGVYGSMEHAQAAKALGLHAIHGAEIDVTDAVSDTPRHLTLLVEDRRGWRNLSHLLTLAHAHTRPDASRRILLPPSVPLEAVLMRTEGLVCLSGWGGPGGPRARARARRGAGDEPTMRGWLTAFGPAPFRGELQRPFARQDRALNRGLASLAR